MVGPVVKLLLLIAATVILILWLIIGIPGSAFAGLLYGFLAPIMATFDAVGEGKEKPFVHCFVVRFIFMIHVISLFYAFLALSNIHYAKTAGWNMEYYHWKLYSSQRFERLAFPLLFFNYG
jgi:hypothetical protein